MTFYDLAIVNIALSCTIFELTSTLKSGFGSLKVIETDTIRKLGTVSYSPSIVTMALYCIISEIKRDIGRKSRFFHTPCIRRPFRGSPRQYSDGDSPVWYRKYIYSFRIHARDGRTEGGTNGLIDTARRRRPRLCAASRGKNRCCGYSYGTDEKVSAT